MKKSFTLIIAIIMVMSLAACGELSQPAASGGGLSGEVQGSQVSGQPNGPTSAANDNPTGTEYNNTPIKIFANEDILAFEVTNPSMGELDKLRLQEESEIMAVIKIPQFEVTLRKTIGDTDLTAEFHNNTGNNVYGLSEPHSLDYKLRWSIVGDTLTVACFAHKYDVSQLLNSESGHAEVRIMDMRTNQDLCNDGFLLNKVPISGDIPEELAAPLIVPNDYTAEDFTYFEYATPKTDDYFLALTTSSDNSQTLRVISFDEKGAAVYVEDIWFTQHPDPNGEWDKDGSGVKYHSDNSKITVSYTIPKADKEYSKEKQIYSYLGPDGTRKYMDSSYKVYFSKPTLYPSQMGMK